MSLGWGFYYGRRGQESRWGGAFVFGFCKIAACVNLDVTLKGLMGVDNAAVAVEESCVLDVKSGTVLLISSGRVLVFNCSLKARYLFCN